MKKKIIIFVVVLLVLGGAGAAYFMFFAGAGPQEPLQPVSAYKKVIIPDEFKKDAPKAEAQVVKKQAPVKKAEVVQKAKPVVKKKQKVTTVKTSKKTVTGKRPYIINLASFPYANKDDAMTLAKKVKKAGYKVYLTKATVKGKDWYRVRVGFYDKKAQADKVNAELKAKFKQSGWVTRASQKEIDRSRK